MTTPLAFPLVNGFRHSFVSIEIKLNGQIFIGFKSINYDRKRTRVKGRGNHPDPLFKTRGSNDYNADAEMYLADFNLFLAALQSFAQQSGLNYGDVFFQVLVTYGENGLDTIQDVINGCTLDTTEAAQAQSDDPLVRKFELSPLKILFNGVDDVSVPLQAPPQ